MGLSNLSKRVQSAIARLAERSAPPYRPAHEPWPVAEEVLAIEVASRVAERLGLSDLGAAAPARVVAQAVRRVEEAQALRARIDHNVERWT